MIRLPVLEGWRGEIHYFVIWSLSVLKPLIYLAEQGITDMGYI